MRKIFASTALTSLLVLAAPAFARGFDSSIQTQVTTPVKVEVVLSKDMAHRANNLPEKRSERGSSTRFNAGFSGNGFYGEKDLAELTQYLESKLSAEFTKRGVAVSDDAPVVLRVTIEDAKPNRPTFTQLGKQPSLSYQSVANGGAELTAELVSAGGASLGTMSYEYFEYDLRDSQYGGTWSDARQSMRRFSKKAAKTLAN